VKETGSHKYVIKRDGKRNNTVTKGSKKKKNRKNKEIKRIKETEAQTQR